MAQDYAYLLRAPKANQNTHQQLYNQSRHDMSMNITMFIPYLQKQWILRKNKFSIYNLCAELDGLPLSAQ